MTYIFKPTLLKASPTEFQQTVPTPIITVGIGSGSGNLVGVNGIIAPDCDWAVMISTKLAEQIGIQGKGSGQSLLGDQKTIVAMSTGTLSIKLAGVVIDEVPCALTPTGTIYDVVLGGPLLRYFNYIVRGGQLTDIEVNEAAVGGLSKVAPKFYAVKI